MRGDTEPGLRDGEIARVEVQPSVRDLAQHTDDNRQATNWRIEDRMDTGTDITAIYSAHGPEPPEALKAQLESSMRPSPHKPVPSGLEGSPRSTPPT